MGQHKDGRLAETLLRLITILLLACACGCSGSSLPETAEGLAAPDAGELRSMLDAEFVRLGIDADKVPQAAPSGGGNAVFDLRAEIIPDDPPSIVFSWTERMLGDYNQDGLVGVSDLTPIGQRYDETVDHDDPALHDGLAHWPTGDPAAAGAANWRAARVDGNDDGLIYLTDITTIAQHWNERLSGYRLYHMTPSMTEFEMYANPADAGSPLTIPRAAADPADANRPFCYSLSYSAAFEPGEFQFYVAPYDEGTDTEGPPSPIIVLPDGEPPVAELTADITAGNPPLEVNFDASGSVDPDGEIIDYAWDFYGDGLFSHHTDVPTAANTYAAGGTFTASVRVEDSQFLRDTADIEITVNQHPQAVLTVSPTDPAVVPFVVSVSAVGSSDPDGTVVQYDWDFDGDGFYDSIDGGPEPPFTYYHTLPGEYTMGLRVIDDGGLADEDTATIVALYGTWDTFTVATGDVGEFCSLVVVDGNPAISYHDYGNTCLGFVRATDELGLSGWNDPLQLTDEMGDEGTYCSMAVINGHPAIAYYASTDTQGRFIRADDPQGTTWPSDSSIILNDGTYHLSLVEADGRPAVVYQTSSANIHYHRSGDANGDFWFGLARNIDLTGDTCQAPSMAIVSGRPGVAFSQFIDGDMKLSYVAAADPAGADPWPVPHVAAQNIGGDAGNLPYLAEVLSHPAITYGHGDVSLSDVAPYYIRSTDPFGPEGTWNNPGPYELAASTALKGRWTAVAGVGLYPHAVFQDEVSGTLWHVWGTDFPGQNWMNPVVIDDGGGTNSVGSFCDLKNVNGRPAVAYYDATANALKYAVLH